MTTIQTANRETAEDRLLEQLAARMERRDRWRARLDTAAEWVGGIFYLLVMLLIWGVMVAGFVVLIRWVLS